ncbi:MAG: regulatory protein RecX [Ignavibacteriaceae bacterium]
MKIIRVVRKDEKNVAIYFDNDQKLILSEDIFFSSGLRKDDEVPDDRYNFFIEQNILFHIKQRALSFLTRRFHSEKELFIKLKSKAYDEILIKKILNELKIHSFIDDRNFAFHFADEKFSRKKWGTNKIRSALFSKGVSGSIIDEVLSSIKVSENNDVLMELAQKKFQKLKLREKDSRKISQKIISFLLSRGFDYESSADIVRKIIKQDFD